MDQAELLSALIGEIYDAALDPSLWTDVVGKAGRFVGGLGATLFSKDAVGRSGNVYCESDGIPETFWQLYFDKYVKFDPATTGRFFPDRMSRLRPRISCPVANFWNASLRSGPTGKAR